MRKTLIVAAAALISLATGGGDVIAQSGQPIGGVGTWQYRVEQDLAKATVYVADYKSATTSLGLRCGGLAGVYISADIGFKAQFLPNDVDVQFDFHKTNSSADDASVEFEAGTVEHGIHMAGQRNVVIVSGGLMRYDDVAVTIHDTGGALHDLQAKFPLLGARDAVRAVFQNCEALRGADPEGLWDTLNQTLKPKKP